MNKKFLNQSKPNPEDIWYVSINGKMVPKEGYQEVYDKDGIFVGKGNYKNGVRNGFWQFFRENGQLESSGYYGNDGLRLSIKEYGDTWNYYDESGTKITFDYDLPKELQEIIDNINKQTANDIFEE
jgi:antitoxin component YwqK of YwqJK toxin-antitoxin module